MSTTPKALREVFGSMARSRVAPETGTHSPWISRLLSELGHEVIVANARTNYDRRGPDQTSGARDSDGELGGRGTEKGHTYYWSEHLKRRAGAAKVGRRYRGQNIQGQAGAKYTNGAASGTRSGGRRCSVRNHSTSGKSPRGRSDGSR